MNWASTADARQRWSVAFRVLAAIVGGYALTSALATLLAVALPVVLPIDRAQAVSLSMDSGFVIYVVILLWVFHNRSATRVWVWLLAWTVVVCAACWLLGVRP